MLYNSDMDSSSLKKMIDFQNDYSPEISVEMDGTFSLTWYGENGSLIIAFPSEKEEVEYSYLGKNGDSDFGEFEVDNRDVFELLRKKAGIESLIKTQILKRK